MTMEELCVNAVLKEGLTGFISFSRILDIAWRFPPCEDISQESLITYAHYATTFFGVSASKLALLTGGNPESNRLWPEAPLSEDEKVEIWQYLQTELSIIAEDLKQKVPATMSDNRLLSMEERAGIDPTRLF